MQVNQTSAQGYTPLAENDSSHNRFDNGGAAENGNTVARTVTREPVVWTRVADSEHGSLRRQVLTRQPKVWTRVADSVPTGSGGWLSQLRKTMQSATERVQVHAQMRHDALNLTGSPALQNGPTWLRGLGKFSAHLRDLVAKLQERAQVSTSSAAAQTPAPASTSNAAVASAAASTAATSGNPSAADAAALANVTAAVQQRFAAQAGDKEAFTALLKQAFGDNFDAAKAETIRQQALAGDFSWAPKVEVVDSKTLTDLSGTQGDGVALGAYVKETDTIYISRELLHSDPAKAQRLLMEEMGHGIDARINTNDAVGDEGEIFAKLMHGDKISAEEMQALKADNDHGVVNINGRQVTVEYGFFKKLGKAISGGAKKLVKSAVNVATGLATFDFNKVKEGLKDGVNAIKDTAKEIHKLAKEQFKKIMQSKWLGIVLQVCRWIPIPVVQMVAKAVELVRAAYMVYQGIKNKSMSMVLGGVASLASGGAKFAGTLGASTATVKMISDVAKAAQRLGQAYNAIANKDLGAAIAVIGSVPGIQGSALATYASYGAQAIGVAKAVRNGDTLAALSQGANLAGSLMPQQPTVNGMDLQSDQAHEARRQQESIAQSDAILSNRLSEASAANQARDEAGHESINGMDLASDQATQGVSDAGSSNACDITTAESGHGIVDAARSRYGENWPSQALDDVKQAIAIAGQVAAARKALKNGDYAAAVESGASIAGNLLDQGSSMRSYVDNAREAANVVQGVQDIKNGNYGAAAARLGKTQIVQDAQQRLSDMLSTRRTDTNGMDVQSDQAYEARRQQESIAQSDAIQSRRLSESATANQTNDRADSEAVNGMDIASDQATEYQNGVTLSGADETNAVASRQNLLDIARARYAENWSSKVVEDVKQVAALAGQVAATRKAIKSGNYAAAVDSGAAVLGKLLDNDSSIKPYVGNAKEAANVLQSVRDIQKGNYEAGLARLEQTQIARTAQQKIAAMVTTQHLDTNGMDVQSDQAYEARRQRESIAQSDAILSRRLSERAAVDQVSEPASADTSGESINGMDIASDLVTDRHGDVAPSSTHTVITVARGQTLDAIAQAQYGDDWRAGMDLMVRENGLRLNANGSPIIVAGKNLVAPDLSNMSSAELAQRNRTGGDMIANNDKGLKANATKAGVDPVVAGNRYTQADMENNPNYALAKNHQMVVDVLQSQPYRFLATKPEKASTYRQYPPEMNDRFSMVDAVVLHDRTDKRSPDAGPITAYEVNNAVLALKSLKEMQARGAQNWSGNPDLGRSEAIHQDNLLANHIQFKATLLHDYAHRNRISLSPEAAEVLSDDFYKSVLTNTQGGSATVPTGRVLSTLGATAPTSFVPRTPSPWQVPTMGPIPKVDAEATLREIVRGSATESGKHADKAPLTEAANREQASIEASDAIQRRRLSESTSGGERTTPSAATLGSSGATNRADDRTVAQNATRTSNLRQSNANVAELRADQVAALNPSEVRNSAAPSARGNRDEGRGVTPDRATIFSFGGGSKSPLDEPRPCTPSNPRGLSVNQQLAETERAGRLGMPTGVGPVGSAEWLKTASEAEQHPHGYQTVKASDGTSNPASEKSLYDKVSLAGHITLSTAGAFPVLGVIPDAVDFLWTAAEIPFGKSNGTDLALAGTGVAATFVPIVGDGAAASAKVIARVGKEVVEHAPEAKMALQEAVATERLAVKAEGVAAETATKSSTSTKAADDMAASVPGRRSPIATSKGEIALTDGLSAQDLVGVSREMRVIEVTGGQSAKTARVGKNGEIVLEDTIIIRNGQHATGIDVFGKNGELIQVGGPAKGSTPEKLERTLKSLEYLKEEARTRNTIAQAFFEKGDSKKFENLILEAQKILGKDNVFILP